MKSGKLKNEMCQWWLSYIEKRVDEYVLFLSFYLSIFLSFYLSLFFNLISTKTNKQTNKQKNRFLTKQGYLHNTLPDDYLNTPPTNMASVLTNQTLLNKIIAEEGYMEGKYGVEKLVGEVVKEVYEKVDSLREEMEFMLEKKWAGLPLGVGWEGGGGGGSDIELEEGGEIMKRDHDYLVEMKEMDDGIEQEKKEGTREKKKLEMSAVVPMAGLVMARFHVYNCELNTAIEHWKMMEEVEERERRRMMRVNSEKMAKVWVGCSPGGKGNGKPERRGWRL